MQGHVVKLGSPELPGQSNPLVPTIENLIVCCLSWTNTALANATSVALSTELVVTLTINFNIKNKKTTTVSC